MAVFIVNGIIAIVIGTFAFKYRSIKPYVLLALFIYISLHYSYAIVAIIGSPKAIMLCRALRATPQIGAKIIALAFLLFSAVLLLFDKRHLIIGWLRTETTVKLMMFFIAWALSVVFYWVCLAESESAPSALTIQNLITCVIMIAFSFAISISFVAPCGNSKLVLNRILFFIMLLIIAMDLFSFFQILTRQTFAGSYNPTGEYALRACALLYNPNVLGLWCSAVAALVAYGFHKKNTTGARLGLFFILIAFALLLSGSRSGLLVCLFMLIVAGLLMVSGIQPKKLAFAFYPLLIFTFCLTCISTLFKLLNTATTHSVKLFVYFSALVDRFFLMPGQIYTYACYKFLRAIIALLGKLDSLVGSSLFHKYIALLSNLEITQQTNGAFVNIDGRLAAGIPVPDNGFLAMYHDTGLPGLLAWCILWGWIVLLGIKALRIDRGPNSVYSLSAVLTCLFAAIFIRAFQVFPIWIMVSIALGLSLGWFQTVLNQPEKHEHP